jgi:hypothetical protein
MAYVETIRSHIHHGRYPGTGDDFRDHGTSAISDSEGVL